MALRIRFQCDTGSKLGHSIERLSDGLFYDFASAAFSAAPAQPIAELPEDLPPYLGRFKATLAPTPAAVFPDGDYVVTVHNTALNNVVVAELGAVMHDGDDATVIPQPFPAQLQINVPGPFSLPITPTPTTTPSQP